MDYSEKRMSVYSCQGADTLQSMPEHQFRAERINFPLENHLNGHFGYGHIKTIKITWAGVIRALYSDISGNWGTVSPECIFSMFAVVIARSTPVPSPNGSLVKIHWKSATKMHATEKHSRQCGKQRKTRSKKKIKMVRQVKCVHCALCIVGGGLNGTQIGLM